LPALWIDGGRFVAAWAGEALDLGSVDALRLPGEHSRLNALAAAGAALALGVTAEQIRAGIAAFSGVPHRMEHVATIDGVDYINDTAATAPAAAVAALRAFAGRDVIAIAGGYDKQLPLDPLADELMRSASQIVLLDGTATPLLQSLLDERGSTSVAGTAGSMEEAVRMACRLATPGAVVLLSPGTASFGLFRDEFHRGEMFRAAVQELVREREREHEREVST
jgi:UDP-N-acetylmuramoylalanine--D-glutamate ligase